jgi:hypothetical protein
MKKILVIIVILITLSTSAMSDIDSTVDEKVKDFIDSNLVILTKEVAIGHGESIDTLAELLNIQDVDMFCAFLQANYQNIDTVLNVKVADQFNSISVVDMQFTIN